MLPLATHVNVAHIKTFDMLKNAFSIKFFQLFYSAKKKKKSDNNIDTLRLHIKQWQVNKFEWKCISWEPYWTQFVTTPNNSNNNNNISIIISNNKHWQYLWQPKNDSLTQYKHRIKLVKIKNKIKQTKMYKIYIVCKIRKIK